MTSIEVPELEPCPFCDYLAGTRPFTILTRDELSATLVTREQRGSGHLLVVPVAHRSTLIELGSKEASAVMSSVIAAAQAITDAYEPEGVAVWQNNGVPAQQTIPHVHFHIAGTLPEGGTEWNWVEEASLADTDRIADKLRPFLR
ncbi:HIT family protein [Actinophytocola xinjiangensis]|uniref:HIT family protein n=1 Tax=Actinophytocola xinjiangensis TaxID=485602 RepID=A0A7Z0WL04_9PSEU|nr:HIT family protein [Actinophytocola xinjiangensis]